MRTCPYCHGDDTQELIVLHMPTIVAACPFEQLKTVAMRQLEIRLCQGCGLGFNARPLSSGELEDLYSHFLYLCPAKGIGVTKYEGLLSLIQRFAQKHAKLVEVGCGDGYLLEQLAKAGYGNVCGIEPSEQAKSAQARMLNVQHAFFDENSLPEKSVDVFVMMHVFEHFENPFAVLAAQKRQLAAGGKIFIEVPHFAGFYHQHLFYYTHGFLHRLAGDLGLKVIHVEMENQMGGELRVVLAMLSQAGPHQIISGPSENLGKLFDKKQEIQEKIDDLIHCFKRWHKKAVVWWGAGAAGVVALNQVPLSLLKATHLSVVDGAASKQGCFIPGIEYPVGRAQDFAGKTVDVVVIGSSFKQEIELQMQQMGLKAREVKQVFI